MTIEVRGATPQDYPAIRETLNDAFGNTYDESGIWDSLVENDPAFSPDCARVALVDGTPVAITVVVPRSVRTRQGWVSGAEITLVGCRTAFQGQGYGSMVVRDALSHMRGRGMALGVFYGEPGYYPRFGCAPVFARHRATLTVKSYRERQTSAFVGTATPVALKPACPSDVPALVHLYNKDMGAYPGAISRYAGEWEWRPRDPASWQVLVLPDKRGYAIASPTQSQDSLYVDDAAAANPAAALQLLEGLVVVAERKGLQNLKVVVPPTHPVHRAMAIFGAESVAPPASPGFAVVTGWAKVLPPGYERTEEGLALGGHLVLRAGTIPLTQLVMGYRDLDDLLYLPGCSLAGDGGDTIRDAGMLRQDFPRLTPCYMHASFYRLH